MNELPPGWEWTTVREVAEWTTGSFTDGPFGSNLKTAHYVNESGPRVIRLQNIGDGFFKDDDQAFITAEHFEKLRRHDARPGDVLIAALGDVLPRACVVPDNIGAAIVKADCFRLRPAPGINPRLVQYLLNSPQVRQSAAHMISGVGRPRLNLSKVGSLALPMPPSWEQEEVVAAIEQQFSRIDAGAASLTRAQHEVNRMRAAILQAAYTGNLVAHNLREDVEALLRDISESRQHRWRTEHSKKYRQPAEAQPLSYGTPTHWRVASLEALTDPVRVICYGILMPRVRGHAEVPYVEVKDLRARRLAVGSLHRTSAELHAAFARSALQAGDVVLAIRGSFDRALVVPSEVAGANVSRDVARIAPLDGIDSGFLAAYLLSPASLRYLRENARGVAVKGVNISDLRSMPVPIPPRAEQAAIVEEMERQFSVLDGVEATLEVAARRAASLRASVFSAAFTGRLRANSSSLPQQEHRDARSTDVPAVPAMAN